MERRLQRSMTPAIKDFGVGLDMTKARQRERKKKRLAEERARINPREPILGASLWDELAAIDARLLSKFGAKDKYTVEEIDEVSAEVSAELEARQVAAIK